VAGLIAGVGLVANSPAVIVASMLVSPLMFPILGVTFGTVITDLNMVRARSAYLFSLSLSRSLALALPLLYLGRVSAHSMWVV
jgi:uncharacterized membrane protein